MTEKILLKDGVKYELWDYDKDETNKFEPIIVAHIKDIFGQDTLYFSKQKLRTISGIGSIPDGFVMDFPNRKWHVLEVELSSHSLYDHIVPQMSKFINGLKNNETRKKIVRTVYDEINGDDILKAGVMKLIGTGELYKTILDMIDKDPTVAIVIEKETSELKEVCSALDIETEIIEFKTFRRENAENVHVHLFEAVYKPKVVLNTQVSKILTEVKGKILELGNDVTEKTYTDHINYCIGRKYFSNIYTEGLENLCIYIRFDKGTFKDPKNMAYRPEDWEDNKYLDEKRIEIKSLDEIDYAMSLIKQAYDYISKQKS